MGLLNKLFGTGKSAKDDGTRDDYGSLDKPPSAEAGAILAAMTKEEKLNFKDLLRRLQEWHESAAEQGPINFHPEARAYFWGVALSKLADHFHAIDQKDKALFFTSAAWNISGHPMCAYNMAILSMEAGDERHAKTLLETYLAEYRKAASNPAMRLAFPQFTEDEAEDIAKSARAKLGGIQSQYRGG